MGGAPKIGSKMGGEFTYQPKLDPIGFDNHSQVPEKTQGNELNGVSEKRVAVRKDNHLAS